MSAKTSTSPERFFVKRKRLRDFPPNCILPRDAAVKVAALIPCFNRRDDLELILRDIAAQKAPGVTLWCVVVDNGSKEPLSTVPVPAGLRVEFVRSDKNTGGSGGFNLGMTHILSGRGITAEMGPPDYLWWVDSDARATPRCLHHLVRVLRKRPDIGAAGSALYDAKTGTMYECGGNVLHHNGHCCPASWGDPDRRFLVKCDYLAACSALVRREAIEQTGLFPENFIYHDDVDWSLHMRLRTGLICVGVPRSKAFHPPFSRRFTTWTRYYSSRNCFSTLSLKQLGKRAIFKRASSDVARAVGQAMMGLPELAELHLRGMKDSCDLLFPSIEPGGVLKPLGMRPFSELGQIVESLQQEAKSEGRKGTLFVHPHLHLRIAGLESARKMLQSPSLKNALTLDGWRHRALHGHARHDLLGAFWRLFTGGTADVAVVPTGWPTNWFRATRTVQVCSEGLLVRRIRFWPTAIEGFRVWLRGMKLAIRMTYRDRYIAPLPPAPKWNPESKHIELRPAVQQGTGL
jgi:GT2 family glycosyltransferase